MKTYNGWKNYETWNVALWIQNDETIYNLAKTCDTYDEFIRNFSGDILGGGTKDGISWFNTALDMKELDTMIKEL